MTGLSKGGCDLCASPFPALPLARLASDFPESLLQVSQDVVDVLDADGKPHRSGSDVLLKELLVAQL